MLQEEKKDNNVSSYFGLMKIRFKKKIYEIILITRFRQN